MKDQLEKFIRDNKSEFDNREPSGRVWKGIERAVMPGSVFWNSVALWRAAAVLFMALSVYLLVPKTMGSPASADDKVLTDFQDVESFYVSEISNKVSLIDRFEGNEGLNGFTQNFQQLDAMYMVLKEEMKNHPSTKVKEALILNLLIQIDLLNKQLDKLDHQEDKKKGEESVS